MKIKIKKSKIYSLISLFLAIALVVSLVPITHKMSINNKREKFVSQRDDLRVDLLNHGMFSCCLEKPCTYCLSKEEGCDCLEEVMNGEHPCGECIGEILEGHGNQYISQYFAKAIAEKTGQEDALKQIIFEKYGTPIEEQV